MSKHVNLYKGHGINIWIGPMDFIPLGDCWFWNGYSWQPYFGW